MKKSLLDRNVRNGKQEERNVQPSLKRKAKNESYNFSELYSTSKKVKHSFIQKLNFRTNKTENSRVKINDHQNTLEISEPKEQPEGLRSNLGGQQNWRAQYSIYDGWGWRILQN